MLHVPRHAACGGARGTVILVCLVALVAGTAAAATAPERPRRRPAPIDVPAQVNRLWPELHDQSLLARLRTRFGPDKLVRDFVTFKTEKGEAATLVLYITGARAEDSGCDTTPFCGCPVYGQVSLFGTYVLALVVGDTVINEVPLALNNGMLPLISDHASNHRLWGQGAQVRKQNPRQSKNEVVKLMKLVDYNGDGHAWEVRFAQHGACGHLLTQVAGYSARQRKAVIYPIIADDTVYWADNLFPAPDDAAQAVRLRYGLACGDHGNETYSADEYAYEPAREAWVRTRAERHACNAVEGAVQRPTRPAAVLHVRNATVPVGQDGTLSVRLQTARAGEYAVATELIVEPPLRVVATGAGTPDCASDGERPTFRFEPQRCLSSPAAAGCTAAMVIGVQVQQAGIAGEVELYRCQVQVPAATLPGTYGAFVSKVRVSTPAGDAVPASATHGGVTVERAR